MLQILHAMLQFPSSEPEYVMNRSKKVPWTWIELLGTNFLQICGWRCRSKTHPPDDCRGYHPTKDYTIQSAMDSASIRFLLHLQKPGCSYIRVLLGLVIWSPGQEVTPPHLCEEDANCCAALRIKSRSQSYSISTLYP